MSTCQLSPPYRVIIRTMHPFRFFGPNLLSLFVRFEDLLSQEEETTSALWAAVGLPPLSPYGAPGSVRDDGKKSPSKGSIPDGGGGNRFSRSRRLVGGDAMSKAPPEVRNRAIPAACRARVAACERDPACELELLR